MTAKNFTLSARVSTVSLAKIKPVLEKLIGSKGTITATEDGFEIKAEMIGESAKELNRTLLSELRRVEKKTRLRAEWVSGNTKEKFFDYVPKGTMQIK
jgi:hypothetical protein